MENGIKSIWVFDGNQPKNLGESTRITSEMNEEMKELLKALGIPAIQAKSSAAAQCALLNKKGIVFGIGGEDLDYLAYGGDILLRHFRNDKKPVVQIEHKIVLKELEITQNQFIDLCILCGTNYTQPIKGIGPARALSYIREYGTLKDTIKAIREPTRKAKLNLKYQIPDEYLHEEAFNEFSNPEIVDVDSIEVSLMLPDR